MLRPIGMRQPDQLKEIKESDTPPRAEKKGAFGFRIYTRTGVTCSPRVGIGCEEVTQFTFFFNFSLLVFVFYFMVKLTLSTHSTYEKHAQ